MLEDEDARIIRRDPSDESAVVVLSCFIPETAGEPLPDRQPSEGFSIEEMFVTAMSAPADHLAVQAFAPDWFRWAVSRPNQSRQIVVEGCSIHYLLWPAVAETSTGRGLLFVHGGGAHAYWWSFIAPCFMRHFRVAAIDLSGMGDSGRRHDYRAEMRAAEMRAVITDAGLGERPFVIGHSFGGFMTMKFASQFGHELGGAVVVDSPICSPQDEGQQPLAPPNWGNRKSTRRSTRRWSDCV